MTQEMRRSRQQLTAAQCEEVLLRGTAGVLALSGMNNAPYAVPVSYVYEEGKLYFHSAKEGHKLDLIRQNPKVSFCVIDRDDVVPEEFTTYFRSVIVFGTMRILEDEKVSMRAIRLLADKFRPGHPVERDAEIARQRPRFIMLELTADRITGKQAIELV